MSDAMNDQTADRWSLDMWPTSIGIGERLATPPLPHHRAYGSVPRRFGGLGLNSIRHGDQPEATEAGLGERQMQRLVGADAPRSSRVHDGGKRHPPGETEATQLVEAPRSGLPLDPGSAAK